MNDYVTIKVYPSTRASLKTISAIMGKTIMEYLDELVSERLADELRRTSKKHGIKNNSK